MDNEDLEKAIFILWSIWQHKNAILHNAAIPDSNEIFRIYESACRSRRDNGEAYQENVTMKAPARSKSLASHVEWIPLEDGCWKLNVDASKAEKSGCGGIGWILHDSSGSISLGFKKINRAWSVKTLELKAI